MLTTHAFALVNRSMKKPLLAATIAALSLSGTAVAHEAGDVILRVGVVHADPDVSSSRVKVEGWGKIAGSSLDMKSDTQAGLTGTYMIMPHFGIEASITTPFSHKIRSCYKGYGCETRGEVSRLSPTISGQFFFLNPKSAFQPYVGLGLNYTVFYDEKFNSKAKREGDKNLSTKDSIGVVAQIGMDYKFSDRVLVNAAIWKMGISSKAEWKGVAPWGTYKAEADVDINPWVYTLGIGFKF